MIEGLARIIAMCIIFGVPRLPIRPCDKRPPAMYGHFCLVPRVSVHDRYYCTFKCLRHRNNYAVHASRLTRTRKVIRDSVQSNAGVLKVHIFRCFQKISLILCNSDIIFRIMFIIKLQTSCGALVTL